MKSLNLVVLAGLCAAAAAPAVVGAQQAQPKDSARRSPASVPADMRPPKGMCRIWLDGVPANQQPASTDCATAVKNRPTSGHVIFGDDYADSSHVKATESGKLPPNIKGFTGVKPPSVTLPKRPPE
jgi:hypothetical protein